MISVTNSKPSFFWLEGKFSKSSFVNVTLQAMAASLGQKELKLIAYLLGINSKDIQTCKLICKSWNFHLKQISPSPSKLTKKQKIKKIRTQKVDDDEKEEEKSYTLRKRKDKSSSRAKNSSKQQTNDTPYSSKSA